MSLLADQRLTGCRAGVGRVLSSVAAGHPGGTRSALDRFRETSIVGRRARGDVPPHPLPSGERLFLIFPRCSRGLTSWSWFPPSLAALLHTGDCFLIRSPPRPGLRATSQVM